MAEGRETDGGAAVAGEIVEVGAAPRVRGHGEGADRGERIGEEAAGEVAVGEGRGFLLDGPVAEEIGTVFEQERD